MSVGDVVVVVHYHIYSLLYYYILYVYENPAVLQVGSSRRCCFVIHRAGRHLLFRLLCCVVRAEDAVLFCSLCAIRGHVRPLVASLTDRSDAVRPT